MSDEWTPGQQPSEMELLRAEMRAGFQSIDKRFVAMDARITSEAEITRRQFDIVAEGLREDMKVVIDKTVATGDKLDRLIVSHSIEHAAFLDAWTDHEVRITRLEEASDTSKPATS